MAQAQFNAQVKPHSRAKSQAN